MAAYDIVLFDLDGTLTESGEGICNCARYTLGAMGLPIPGEDVLRRFIGPPIRDNFRLLCGMNEEQCTEGIRIYRKRYDEIGWKENRLYGGIASLLDALLAAGVRLGVATTKPLPAAQRILQYFGIADKFSAVAGANQDGSRSLKRELIPWAVETISGQPMEQARCGNRIVMVGDTHFDAAGAQETGIDFIGVLYGYGTEEELRSAGGQNLVSSVQALGSLLLGQPGWEPAQ